MNAQTYSEADLLSGIVDLALAASGLQKRRQAPAVYEKELRSLLRAVEPQDLVLWRDWWREAKASEPGVIASMPLPENAKVYGLGMGWFWARRAADAVLELAAARQDVREAEELHAEAVTSLRSVSSYR